ncbi:MAG: prephenate dehydratase [Syntrophomonadaceae bacterium]|jgi:prephenate dehydratase|nr:prephenate dehydratase [Bacillota bacterium]HQA50019.1 prephenate dehydratase [Syntrophomonadaceae bacterium]HQD90202.1 prephenate dehydratase [Syntrophomonadaceae bacterium]
MIMGILGPQGTFSEAAAISYCSPETELVYAESIQELFIMLGQQVVSDILIPFENSSAGILRKSLAGLMEYPVTIKGETIVPIEQHLMSLHEYELTEIELVVTQPAVLAQCENYLKSHLPDARIEIAESTARAAQVVARESRRAAAIGPRQAAQNYGLIVLASGIQQEDNCTRFLHLSKREVLWSDSGAGDKGSILLELENQPGALYKAIEIFARRNINLCKIESYPVNNKKGYRFYIEAHMPGENLIIKDLLGELDNHCRKITYLGKYKQHREDIKC